MKKTLLSLACLAALCAACASTSKPHGSLTVGTGSAGGASDPAVLPGRMSNAKADGFGPMGKFLR